jgi:hypothetical protein
MPRLFHHLLGHELTHTKEAAPLWHGEPATPTTREKEHILVFHVGERKFTSEKVRCGFQYDLDEIMTFGHSPSPMIPEHLTFAAFPEQPWQLIVNIQVKRSVPFGSWTNVSRIRRSRLVQKNP